MLVTVADIMGSAPRAIGSRMLVTPDRLYGSIGGGNLEFTATKKARKLLEQAGGQSQQHETYGLGPALNQCCGGAVVLLYEVFHATLPAWLRHLLEELEQDRSAVLVTAVDGDRVAKWLLHPDDPPPPGLPGEACSAALSFARDGDPANRLLETSTGRYLLEVVSQQQTRLYLFGAGHTGKALVKALGPLPFDVTWLDDRPGQFPEDDSKVRRIRLADLPAEVASCRPGSVYLVMTHSHAMDEDICYEVLKRNDARWLGVIGSVTKRRRFVHRLAQRGIDNTALRQLVCPIGLSGVTGKRPATIAVAVVAQLLCEVVPEAWR